MPSSSKRSPRTAGVALALVTALAVAGTLLAGASHPARAATQSQLRQRIHAGQGAVSALSGAVSADNKRIRSLGASAAALESQIARLQTDLDAKRAELLKLRSELEAARTRLAQLQARQTHDQQVLAQQLVGSYESDRPDVVTVVLESTGFQNLLERLAFAQRIGNQDAHITGQVRAARRAVAAEATRLGALSLRQQRLTAQVLTERNRVASARIALVSQQLSQIKARDRKSGQLSAVRGTVASLRSQLGRLQAAAAAAARRAAERLAAQRRAASTPSSGSGSSGSSGSTGSPSGPVPTSSSGSFTFPMPRGDASPPGTWSLDDGVDISAPGGTPEVAVCSGTVVLHGIGGFGPSAPVIHCDSPLSGDDYVYYGHAGPGNWTPVGTHVGQGQVISQVGYGIVGISTGPHLEIGFADSSGSPIGPSSAPAMMALLQASY